VGVERRVAERAVLEHHRDRVRRRAACAANNAGKVAGGTGCVVSFQVAQDGVALGRLQDRQVAQRLAASAHRGLQAAGSDDGR
jgi:hypothetical protein